MNPTVWNARGIRGPGGRPFTAVAMDSRYRARDGTRLTAADASVTVPGRGKAVVPPAGGGRAVPGDRVHRAPRERRGAGRARRELPVDERVEVARGARARAARGDVDR